MIPTPTQHRISTKPYWPGRPGLNLSNHAMSVINPNNLGYKVSSRNLSWLQMVERAWGAEFTAPDHGIYEWSNGRKFDSTDRGTTGIYTTAQGPETIPHGGPT